MRPAKAIILEDAGRGSSIPYISAFSKEGRASMILGVIISPSAAVVAWSSRNVDLLLETVMGLDEGTGVLLVSAIRLRAIAITLRRLSVSRLAIKFCFVKGGRRDLTRR